MHGYKITDIAAHILLLIAVCQNRDSEPTEAAKKKAPSVW